MKFLSFILALTMFSSACNIRDNSKKRIETLKIQEEMNGTTVEVFQNEFDFGEILEGETVIHNFEFKNTGSTPLIISNATAACGCTIPEKPLEPIMPGETGTIKVKFDSKGRKGKMYKNVTVVANADFPQLVIKGHVIKKEA